MSSKYYCRKCKHHHYKKSKIGKSHRPKSNPSAGKKYHDRKWKIDRISELL